MDTLTNIVVSLLDTSSIVATPKEEIFHSCPDTMPIGNVITICVTVVICLMIITIAICRCYKKAQEVKRHEIDKKFKAEEDKRNSEQNLKKMQDQYDSAWRTFEYMLKGKLPEDSKDAGTEAKEYIQFFWKQRIFNVTKDPQS